MLQETLWSGATDSYLSEASVYTAQKFLLRLKLSDATERIGDGDDRKIIGEVLIK